MRRSRTSGTPNWLTAIRRYLEAVIAGSLVWEIAQLPLYTIWQTGTAREIALAILHCTVGDVLIAIVALTAALVLAGSPAWPDQRFGRVLTATVVLSASYTVYSEYVNTVVRKSWSYTSWMPALPWFGTGVAPFAQWLVIPPLALVWSHRAGQN